MEKVLGADGDAPVQNRPCLGCYSHLAVCGAAEFGRLRLTAMASSEFFVLFLTCFRDATQRGARRARVVDSGLKLDASYRRFWVVLVPVLSVNGAALDSRAIGVRNVALRTYYEGDKALLAYIRARQEVDWETVLPSNCDILGCPYIYYYWKTVQCDDVAARWRDVYSQDVWLTTCLLCQ